MGPFLLLLQILPISAFFDQQVGIETIAKIQDTRSTNITDANFDELAQNPNDWFIFFYSPSCSKCTLVRPQWKFFAKSVQEKEKALNVGRVDASQELQLVQRFGIHKVPSIVYYKDGYAYSYNGRLDQSQLYDVWENNLYLQYDRIKVKPVPTKFDEQWNRVRHLIKKHSKECIVGSIVAVVVLIVASKLVNSIRKKEKED